MNYEEVTWLDSRSDDGWTEQESLDMQVAKITTVGHVAKETAEVLCIASSMDEHTGQASGIMFIPKQCIISRWVIEKDHRRCDTKPSDIDRAAKAQDVIDQEFAAVAADREYSLAPGEEKERRSPPSIQVGDTVTNITRHDPPGIVTEIKKDSNTLNIGGGWAKVKTGFFIEWMVLSELKKVSPQERDRNWVAARGLVHSFPRPYTPGYPDFQSQ